MNLLKKQTDISSQRPMPTNRMDDSFSVDNVTGEIVALSYYNGTTLTTDAGQAAGTLVIGKIKNGPILDAVGTKEANVGNTSLVFTCLAFTNERPFPWEYLEKSTEANGTTLLQNVCADFNDGDYCVDYRTGTIYGKKATTASSMTAVSYKRPVSSGGGGSGGGGSSSVSAEYISPTDFTATYTTASTITLTGLPYTLTSGVQVVYIKVRDTATNLTTTYVAGAGGYGFGFSAGVITAYKDGVVTNIFASTNMYEVGLNGQEKSYDPTVDVTKTIDQSPLSAKNTPNSLLDTTNIAAATNYYPSATGMTNDGYRPIALSGKFIDADGTMTMTIEETCDEDSTNADWIDTTASWINEKAAPNTSIGASITVTNGTVTFKIIKTLVNSTFIRVKMVNDGATNTGIIKMRQLY